MKLGISLDDNLVARIDSYVSSNYMSRSGLISLACTQFLNANEVVVAVKELSLAMRKIAESGSIDVDTRKKLEDFERLSQFLLSVQK
jgi:metal-responsive CopG/Arc/MetJ family transcriptional regulator